MHNVNHRVAFTAKPFDIDRTKFNSMVNYTDDDRAERIVSESPQLATMNHRDQSNLTVKLADELCDLRKQTALYQMTGSPTHLKYVVDTAKAIDLLAFNRPQ